MAHAVISCLHANHAALEAVLADIDQQGIDTITCLGDLVGYGPQPNEVVELIRQRAIPTCQGCWDEDIIEGLNACDCSYPSQLAERRGHLAHQWTADQLSEENKDFLANLPMSLRRDRLLFVHGSPNSQHEYLLPNMDAFAALERVETSSLCAGAAGWIDPGARAGRCSQRRPIRRKRNQFAGAPHHQRRLGG